MKWVFQPNRDSSAIPEKVLEKEERFLVLQSCVDSKDGDEGLSPDWPCSLTSASTGAKSELGKELGKGAGPGKHPSGCRSFV